MERHEEILITYYKFYTLNEQDEYYFRAYYMYKYIGGISSLSFSLFILSYSAARKMEDDLKIRKIENILASDSADKKYKEAFADIEAITMNPMNPDGDANNWLSCMTIAPDCSVTPDQVMDALAEYNIETRPIWKPMHLQPVFADCDFIQVKEGRSVSEDIFNRGVCLPSDIKNTPEDMKLIISLIRKVFEK